MSVKRNVLAMQQKLLSDSTPFAIRESFNHLRTNLTYTANLAEGCPVFAMTSATESAGKSMVMANIAISFAFVGKKVLLIDADMRAPVQADIFKMDSESDGLSELLSGIVEEDTAVIHPSHIKNLDILLSGKIPPNPSELIMGSRFIHYLEKWKQSYDAIFIDFPPVGIVTDALALRNEVSGYVFVVRSGRSDTTRVQTVVRMMQDVNAKILGIILNDVNAKNTRKASHYESESSIGNSHYESSYDQTHKSHYERSYEKSHKSHYERSYEKSHKSHYERSYEKSHRKPSANPVDKNDANKN